MIQVECRCHGRLNELLPPSQRGRARLMRLKQAVSLQQLLIPLRIPHPEVDLALINGVPVALSCQVQDGDHLHLYPDIGDIDDPAIIPLRRRPLQRARFILDVHLGRLARRMRLLGLDTWYRNHMDDRPIIRLARLQSRMILTRDRGLLQQPDVSHGYYVRATHPEKQLREVLARFEAWPWLAPFSRCTRCNSLIERLSPEEVQRRVRPRLSREFDTFFRCTGCDQLYWQGSHYDRLRAYVDQLRG
ncbi:Mut7-C RNAse domain-containing protein [Marinobacterium aestuariivivens]|uniref:Mut7-C RNAse domain-containing protein n=1 Tax=Marinobacterium aestuariivivens TaxID=1698799 RepID=A0ABW2A1W0_9GAMM